VYYSWVYYLAVSL